MARRGNLRPSVSFPSTWRAGRILVETTHDGSQDGTESGGSSIWQKGSRWTGGSTARSNATDRANFDGWWPTTSKPPPGAHADPFSKPNTLFFSLSLSLSMYLSVCLSVCQSIYLSIYLSVHTHLYIILDSEKIAFVSVFTVFV